MKLIVGLGNPGLEYQNTRHNVGFMFIDHYLNHNISSVDWREKYNGIYFKTKLHGEDVIFLKPQSFMNLSGTVVKKYIDYFNIDISDVLIVSDDLDLFIGNFKLRLHGSSGGHNGLKNIESSINTAEYKRLKIGISSASEVNKEKKEYVLSKFSEEELIILNKLFDYLCNAMDDYFLLNFEMLMSKYNQKNR